MRDVIACSEHGPIMEDAVRELRAVHFCFRNAQHTMLPEAGIPAVQYGRALTMQPTRTWLGWTKSLIVRRLRPNLYTVLSKFVSSMFEQTGRVGGLCSGYSRLRTDTQRQPGRIVSEQSRIAQQPMAAGYGDHEKRLELE